MKQWSRNCFK